MRVPQAVTERSFALIARLLAAADVAGDGTLVLDGRPLTSERMHDAVRLQWAEEGCEGETPDRRPAAPRRPSRTSTATGRCGRASRSSATCSRAASATATTRT